MLNTLPTILNTAALAPAGDGQGSTARVAGEAGTGFAALMQQQTHLRQSDQRQAEQRAAAAREQRPAPTTFAAAPPTARSTEPTASARATAAAPPRESSSASERPSAPEPEHRASDTAPRQDTPAATGGSRAATPPAASANNGTPANRAAATADDHGRPSASQQAAEVADPASTAPSATKPLPGSRIKVSGRTTAPTTTGAAGDVAPPATNTPKGVRLRARMLDEDPLPGPGLPPAAPDAAQPWLPAQDTMAGQQRLLTTADPAAGADEAPAGVATAAGPTTPLAAASSLAVAAGIATGWTADAQPGDTAAGATALATADRPGVPAAARSDTQVGMRSGGLPLAEGATALAANSADSAIEAAPGLAQQPASLPQAGAPTDLSTTARAAALATGRASAGQAPLAASDKGVGSAAANQPAPAARPATAPRDAGGPMAAGALPPPPDAPTLPAPLAGQATFAGTNLATGAANAGGQAMGLSLPPTQPAAAMATVTFAASTKVAQQDIASASLPGGAPGDASDGNVSATAPATAAGVPGSAPGSTLDSASMPGSTAASAAAGVAALVATAGPSAAGGLLARQAGSSRAGDGRSGPVSTSAGSAAGSVAGSAASTSATNAATALAASADLGIDAAEAPHPPAGATPVMRGGDAPEWRPTALPAADRQPANLTPAADGPPTAWRDRQADAALPPSPALLAAVGTGTTAGRTTPADARVAGLAGEPPHVADLTALPALLPASGSAGVAATSGNPFSGVAAPVAEARIPVPLDSPAFAPALGAQVSLFARDGVQTALLQLNPADMGPISVLIAVDGHAARVDFQADLAVTRDVIEASLPALAGALQDAGLTLTGGGVFQQPQGRQSPHDNPPAGAAPARLDRGPAAADSAPPGAPPRAASRGLVDLVA